MARTRSKPAPKAPPPAESTPSTIKALPPSVSNAPKLFVLPKDTSEDTRIVTLDNPATGTPSRYLFCVEKGFYEFTRIVAPRKACKSWLITSEGADVEEKEREKEGLQLGSGYVSKSPDLFIATPVDILFLILPALAPKTAKETKQHFLCLDDHLDTLTSLSPHWKGLLKQFPKLKQRVETRMQAICDTVDAGDETMYRISQEKLLGTLVKKAERMSAGTFPASLEEKFIKSALEVPIMNIKREDSGISEISTTTSIVLEDAATPSTTTESQLSVTTSQDSQTTATTVSSDSEAPSKPALATPPEIPHLLRLRTSFTYLTTTYLPPTLRTHLTALLSVSTSTSIPNFAPLTTHLAALAVLKAEALSLRSISDNISHKRNFEEDEERIAEREEKKRKKDEDEKKKKNESRAVKQLKKVDTSGMKKMSSFFTKAAPKKKA
ncbi:hypothetical protein K505DRAFT_327033 [Melanomma pulvis-pyrius CBS 109.77]|uniref:Ribonuclease H2 subunit B n=1 Tax=Melanomma pulvis-pyrius CBS 109.77 TaxID=1314802 RepID=A0A6A6X515_9PLEO|nr:hypothetical protein K505DRAFT_327033 [Melanomma pulvis-pyrius CBS 109.77]